jgi:hypothetical protein
VTELKDLVGERVLEIVPNLNLRHPLSQDASGVLFTLDRTTYLVFEDLDDGYRSHAGPILSYEGAAYELGYDGYGSPVYIREKVICSHRTNGEYSGEADVLEMRSAETGALVFAIGTENTDDYYPSYFCAWHPEGLSANAKANAHD